MMHDVTLAKPRAAFLAAIASSAFLAFTDAAQAATQPVCQLKRIVSLDMQTEPDGTITVPAALDGRTGQFEVDTGGVPSMISGEFADALGLTRRYAEGGAFLNNAAITQSVTIQSFTLGPIRSDEDFHFYVLPASMSQADLAGTLAPDLMRNYDVDFDFAGGKLNLFLPDHCPGKVVYWTTDAFAAMPMDPDNRFHIVISATLDGKPVNVVVDTGAPRSIMSLDNAIKLFGWDRDKPPVRPLKPEVINVGEPVAISAHSFGALTFDGINVVNPDIELLPGSSFARHSRNENEIILGMSVLRQLHIYIAYKENMIYLSSAEAH